MSITVASMKPKLLTLDQVRESLGRTEPLTTCDFAIGDAVRFRLEDDWHHHTDSAEGTDPVRAYIQIGKGPGTNEYQLTKDALLEATSVCGLTKTYSARCPGPLLEPQLNYWFREGLSHKPIRDYQLLIAGGNGAAITRASIQPFSNLRLLEQVLHGIEARYGSGEVLADYKFQHSLRKTHLRLIVSEHMRAIHRSGTEGDLWSAGIQVKNSLIGEERTSIDGYLFRWVCTNGQIDTQATSGVWSRRGGSTEQEVYDWARTAVDEVLGGLEPALDAVQALVDIPVAGEANEILRDVFSHYGTPLPERAKIIENMVDTGGQLTMYTVMNAITRVANDANMEPSHVESLLRMGGDLPHAASSRCEACRRLMPH